MMGGGFDFGLAMLGVLVAGLGILALCTSLGFGVASLFSLLRRSPDLEAGRWRALVGLTLALGSLMGTLLFFTRGRFPNASHLWMFSIPPLGLALAALLVWCIRSRLAQTR